MEKDERGWASNSGRGAKVDLSFWSSLIMGAVLAVLFPQSLAAQTLEAHVIDESGARISAGTTELVFSQGQALVGTSQSGSTSIDFGFLNGLPVEAISPMAGNPPFSMVGVSSVAVNWLANGNPAGTLYYAQISPSADFSSVTASSQTYNESAAFIGLNANTLYYVHAAAYSILTSTWCMFSPIGSTYTLAVAPGSPPDGISTFTAVYTSSFTLNWSSGTQSTGYNSDDTLYLAQISTKASFVPLWASSQTLNLNAIFTNLNESKKYYAQVQAVNANNIPSSFTILGSAFTQSFPMPLGIINTVAGNGDYSDSGDGGPATSGAMYDPQGVAVDSTGNVYIADSLGQRVRKVDTSGIITTVAGNGQSGSWGDGGLATSATLNGPRGVTVDSIGNFYIADEWNHRIRKVDASGIITTVAGNGSQGFSGDGDQATSASLHNPFSVAVDEIGNIYIGDLSFHVRKVGTDGVIHTVAGNGSRGYSGDGGPATSAAMGPPHIAVDEYGNIYIADGDNNRIRKVDTNGIIETIAGTGNWGYSGDGGQATSAELYNPVAVAVDSHGDVYMSDNANVIRKVDANGIINTIAGTFPYPGYSGDGGLATSAKFSFAYGVAIDAFRNIYVSDRYNRRIRQVAVSSSTLSLPVLSASAQSPTSIQWSWSGLNYAAAYRMVSSTGGAISSVLSNRTTYFIETNISTNTLYARELVAINSMGSSTSAVVSTYTLSAAPIDLAMVSVASSAVHLTWNANGNPNTTNFEVSYTTSTGFAVDSDISTAPLVTSTFTTVDSLASGTSYYFRVRAYNGGGFATAFSLIVSTYMPVLQSSVTAMTPSSGTIGATLAIFGSGFGTGDGDNTRVRFGINGSTAPISLWTDTQISAIVPLLSSGAYAVAIERQTGSTVTITSAGTFTVATPHISTITPSFGNASFDIEGSGFGEYVDTGTTKVTFNGTPVDLSAWHDAMIRVVPDDISVGTYTVVVVLSPSVGTVQSNEFLFEVTEGMKSLGLLAGGSSGVVARPPAFYQANLRLRVLHGGKVTAPSRASVTVPPWALDADTSVTIDRGAASGAAHDAREQARISGALGGVGVPVEFGPRGARFSVPVIIELPYDPADIPLGQEYKIAVHYWDQAAGVWLALQSDVDTARHRVRARTDHFSVYQPLLPGVYSAANASAAFGLRDVYAFPNPARNNRSVTIRSQVGLADQVDVNIYDIAGRVMRSGNISSWQILDDGNGKGPQFTYDYVWDTGGIGSGVYIYSITARKAGSSPIRKTGKVGVIK